MPDGDGAVTARRFSRHLVGEVDLSAAVVVLSEKIERVRRGNLEDAEALLMYQANTLNAMFCDLGIRAAANTKAYPEAAKRFLRMASKARGQCRATLETLVLLKSPPVVFARQANIANGPQQVNNTAAEPGSRARVQCVESEK